MITMNIESKPIKYKHQIMLQFQKLKGNEPVHYPFNSNLSTLLKCHPFCLQNDTNI